MAEDNKVKVQLSDELGNVETLWADPLGSDLYRLDNTPWYAYRVSWHDVVEARQDKSGGFPVFVRVVEKSGYRTIRLILKPPADRAPESQAVLDHLRSLGCTYEGANPGFLAIDVPPSVELDVVRQYLISTGQEWEHGDPKYEDLFPNESGVGPAG